VLGRLFLLFTVVPLVELALLIRVGRWLGALPTVGLVAATGLAGAWLARRESTRSWRAVRDELAAGRVPGEELLHTLFIVLAGALLVTPGVLTDVVGLLALVRPVRALGVEAARARLARGLEEGTVRFFHAGPFGASDDAPPGGAPDRGPAAGPDDEEEDGWHRRPSPEAPGDDDEGPTEERPGRVVDV
jgi:UPF0716 protein FxsA